MPQHQPGSSTAAGERDSHRDSALQRASGTLRELKFLRAAVLGARRQRTLLIERWLNIDTTGETENDEVQGACNADTVGYAPTDYLLLRKFMAPVRHTPEDVVVDIGCGMGRLLCLYARKDVRKCLGIECDERLASAARDNAARLRGRRAPLEIRTQDATLADYSEGTIFWFFNPFGPQTLRVVLERIRKTVDARPRRIQVIYVHTVLEEEFERSGWLRRTRRVESPFFLTQGASYWNNVPE